MSDEILAEIKSVCRESAVNVCWRQWRNLGALISATSTRKAESIVDPEALLLLSIVMRKDEKRLVDVIQWWAKVGSSLISVQRVRSLLAKFSGDAPLDISVFAQAALEYGDGRWRRFAREKKTSPARELKGPEKPALVEPSALLLRFRAGFGLNVKSDLLAVLLGSSTSAMTVKRLSEALSYSVMAVSSAAQEMSGAGFVLQTPDRPVAYFVRPIEWEMLLKLRFYLGELDDEEPSRQPVWRFWSQLFSFLAQVLHWSDRQLSGKLDPYVQSSKARDFFLTHQNAFALNGISVPDPARFKGEKFLSAFLATMKSVSEWLDRSV